MWYGVIPIAVRGTTPKKRKNRIRSEKDERWKTKNFTKNPSDSTENDAKNTVIFFKQTFEIFFFSELFQAEQYDKHVQN